MICQGKSRYPTEQEALDRIAEIRREGPKRKRKPFRCYLCPDCNGWHLSSMSKKKHRTIQKEKRKKPRGGISRKENREGLRLINELLNRRNEQL